MPGRRRYRHALGRTHPRRSPPVLVYEALARTMIGPSSRRYRVNGRQRSLREISAELANLGYTNGHGRPFAAASIRAMVE